MSPLVSLCVVTSKEEIIIKTIEAKKEDLTAAFHALVGGKTRAVRIPHYTDRYGFIALANDQQEGHAVNATASAFCDNYLKGDVVFTVNTPVDFLSLEPGEMELLVDKLSLIRFGPKEDNLTRQNREMREGIVASYRQSTIQRLREDRVREEFKAREQAVKPIKGGFRG